MTLTSEMETLLRRLSDEQQQLLACAVLAAMEGTCDRVELYGRNRGFSVCEMNRGDKRTAFK